MGDGPTERKKNVSQLLPRMRKWCVCELPQEMPFRISLGSSPRTQNWDFSYQVPCIFLCSQKHCGWQFFRKHGESGRKTIQWCTTLIRSIKIAVKRYRQGKEKNPLKCIENRFNVFQWAKYLHRVTIFQCLYSEESILKHSGELFCTVGGHFENLMISYFDRC